LSSDRKKQLTSPATELEKTELRGLLGAMQWLVGQSRLDVVVDINLLQSQVKDATVETLLEANKALRKLRQKSDTKLIIRKIDGPCYIVAWSDASWANRKDGSSTGGYIITVCGEGVISGRKEHITVLSWSTNKQKCRHCQMQKTSCT
jgi:hypothetical protein